MPLLDTLQTLISVPFLSVPQLVLCHGASTLVMTGLILFVQWVHYPLFNTISPQQWPQYAATHQQRTTHVVAPIMLIEAFSGIALLYRLQDIPGWFWLNILLLITLWLSTGIIQVPLHHQLRQYKNSALISRLVGSNWIRTLCWLSRSMVLLRYGQTLL